MFRCGSILSQSSQRNPNYNNSKFTISTQTSPTSLFQSKYYKTQNYNYKSLFTQHNPNITKINLKSKRKYSEKIDPTKGKSIDEKKFTDAEDEPETQYGGNVGIDLGTTNTCVASYEGEKLRVLENSEGHRTTPSIVAWGEDGEKMVGIAAKRQRIMNPYRTLYATKRIFGRKFNDPVVQKHIANVSYKIKEGKDGEATLEVEGLRSVTAKDVATEIMIKARETAEKHFGKPPFFACVGVPASYDKTQREAVIASVKKAGIPHGECVNEPTAAAVAYGYLSSEEGIFAVYDLGGGTFDISIMEIQNNVYEVLATAGDPFLGGDDFDALILKKFLNDFKRKNKIDLTSDPIALQRLRDSVENAKIELSSTIKTAISIPFITADAEGQPLHFSCDFSRSQFERFTDDLFERTKKPCKQALKDARIDVLDINSVIAVGGMSKTQRVAEVINEIFQIGPSESTISCDEAVAMGCAIMAEVLVSDLQNVVVVDLTPLAFGVEVEGGFFSRVIERGTKIPARVTKVYSNAVSNQRYVTIRVYQGDRDVITLNRYLGQFDLGPLPRAPAGNNQIRVTFEFNSKHILKVEAEEVNACLENSIQIEPIDAYPSIYMPEIERAQDTDSEHFSQRQSSVAVDRALSALQQARDKLNSVGKYFSPDQRKKIFHFMRNLEDAFNMNYNDYEGLLKATHALEAVLTDIVTERHSVIAHYELGVDKKYLAKRNRLKTTFTSKAEAALKEGGAK